jgi:hypothetical protein
MVRFYLFIAEEIAFANSKFLKQFLIPLVRKNDKSKDDMSFVTKSSKAEKPVFAIDISYLD